MKASNFGKLGRVLLRAPASAGEGGGARTVLHVEDEESDAMFMEWSFAEKGLAGRLGLTRDGRAAIDYLSGAGRYGDREKHPSPALVLLDLHLPQVPWFGVLEHAGCGVFVVQAAGGPDAVTGSGSG